MDDDYRAALRTKYPDLNCLTDQGLTVEIIARSVAEQMREMVLQTDGPDSLLTLVKGMMIGNYITALMTGMRLMKSDPEIFSPLWTDLQRCCNLKGMSTDEIDMSVRMKLMSVSMAIQAGDPHIGISKDPQQYMAGDTHV